MYSKEADEIGSKNLDFEKPLKSTKPNLLKKYSLLKNFPNFKLKPSLIQSCTIIDIEIIAVQRHHHKSLNRKNLPSKQFSC